MEHKGKSKHGLSKEDRKFIQIAERGIQHREEGHYELPLPLKNETIELPNNKTAALRRLSQLKRRFVGGNGQQYYEHYVEFMKKLIENIVDTLRVYQRCLNRTIHPMVKVERSKTFGTFHTMEFIIQRSPIRFV